MEAFPRGPWLAYAHIVVEILEDSALDITAHDIEAYADMDSLITHAVQGGNKQVLRWILKHINSKKKKEIFTRAVQYEQ